MSAVNLTKKNYNGGEWSPDLWHRSDLAPYTSGCKTMLNMVPRIQGGVDNRAGTYFVNETKFSFLPSRVVSFIFSTQQAYILEFGNYYIRFYADDGIVVNGGLPVEVATPYAAADVALLKFEQSADVLFIMHPSYPPATLSRVSVSSFVYAAITFAPTQPPPTGLTSSSTGTHSFVVTAVAESESESIGSNVVSGTSTSVFTWTAPTGAQPDHYNIYVNVNGSYFYIGKTDGSVTTFTNTATLEANANTAISPPQATNPFSGTNSYPGCAAFFGGRLNFARTNNQPQTIFGSVSGDFENMNVSSPVQDSDAFTFTINSRQVNEIRWVCALRVCIIGTSGGEWLMQPGTNENDITPTSVSIQPQSNWGVSDVPPIVIGYQLLFVQASTKIVRSLSYALAIDAYDGQDISILARHLFVDYGILAWAYQPFPNTCIWAVRADGVLCGLTFYAEDKVAGWHRHTTQGTFESVAAIPLPTGDTEVWFIVNRTIGGQTRRYVERLDNREWLEIQDAFFVDCGLSYSGSPATTFTNLNQLEGMDVVALADGNVVTGLTVTNGMVSIPNAASDVHIGLSYTCQLETLDLTTTLPNGLGELASNKRNVQSVSVSLENTRECFIGPSPDKLIELAFRTTETYGQATNLFTGEKKNNGIPPGDQNSSSVFIQTVNPVPLSINSLSAVISYGDR